MQEVQSPELKKMQEAMKNLLEKISPEEMQKMMKNYKFNEEQFRKSIERTLVGGTYSGGGGIGGLSQYVPMSFYF